MRLLLLEEENRTAQSLSELLRLEKYEVDHYADGVSGLSAIESGIYDLIVLDAALPCMSGLEVTRKTRQKGIRTPILMLSEKGGLEDKVAGLDSGADDYVVIPFMARELTARLRALGRRNINTPDGSLAFGDIMLDTGTLTLTCRVTSKSVRLSEKEYRILEYLIANQGQILTREMLAVKIWGHESNAEYNNVEVYVSFTRRKLIFVGAETKIKAVRGIGYELQFIP